MAQTAPKAARGEGPVLLERERELEAIERALERLGEGIGSLIMVEGPAGIGKTAVLTAAAALVRDRAPLLRSARGGELEREMAFGVARQLFEPTVERMTEEQRSRVLAGSAEMALIALGREDPERPGTGDPFAPIHGLYWLVANLAETQPLVLVVDDAHWIDSQTLRWLVYLARRLEDIPVLVIASVRSGEPGQPAELDPLRLEGAVLRPAPLSRDAVEAVIATELDSKPAPEFSAVCADATAGNPFLLAEVVRTLRADGVEPSAEAAHSIAALGPESVARYVLMRLGRFGEEAISLARVIAILGGSPRISHVAQLASLDEEYARDLCDRLREAEILAPGLPIAFVHPLVRSAIYLEHPEEARSAAHRRAAEVLSDAGGDVGEIASQLMACPPSGDQWVVERLGEAAREAMRAGAHNAAQSYLERALAEPPEDDLPLRYALGRCMMQTDPERVPEVMTEVIDRTADMSFRLRALRDVGMANFVTGAWHQAAKWYERAFEESPSEERLALEAQIYTITAGTGRNEAISRRIETVAERTETETVAGCLAHQALGYDRFWDGARVEEVFNLLSHFPPPRWYLRSIVPSAAAMALAWSGRWSDARRDTALWAESVRGAQLLTSVSYGFGSLAVMDHIGGRLADAESEARTALEIVGTVSPSTNPARLAINSLIAILITRGAVEEASSLAAGVDLSKSAFPFILWSLELRGYLHLAQGELEKGVDDLLRFGEDAEGWRAFNPAGTAWRQEVAPALAALERTAEARKLIAVAEQRAQAFGAAHTIGTVLRARGLIEPKQRQIRTFEESVRALETYGPPHELARALLELGAALRRDGRRTDSREPLRRALELAHSCGAGGIEARAREELAAAGSRPRTVYRTGLASLTASELRTGKLAAEGLSNVEIAQRLFVSRKTVEKHLGNAYMKLEIEGRDQLGAALQADVGA